MRHLMLLMLAACGGASAPAPARTQVVTCEQVIRPMVQRQISASVTEIATREHLDRDEHDRLDRLARERGAWLTATMEQSCTDDHWSNAALLCYNGARTDDQMRICDRQLSDTQRTAVLRRAGM
jgi:hypothetical protein